MARTKVNVHYVSAPKDAQPGDLVVDINKAGYRMDGVCIIDMDGKLIELDYEQDEYGAIPKSLTCPDKFTPRAILDAENIPDVPFKWHNNLVPINMALFKFERFGMIEYGGSRVYLEKYNDMTFAFVVPEPPLEGPQVKYFELSHQEDVDGLTCSADYIFVDPVLL